MAKFSSDTPLIAKCSSIEIIQVMDLTPKLGPKSAVPLEMFDVRKIAECKTHGYCEVYRGRPSLH